MKKVLQTNGLIQLEYKLNKIYPTLKLHFTYLWHIELTYGPHLYVQPSLARLCILKYETSIAHTPRTYS